VFEDWFAGSITRSLVRWRQRLGADGIESSLQETIAAARRSEAIKP
jgi:hypothetical protein